MSWWRSSTPVSRTPTLTVAEPVVTAHAWSALIWVMSQRLDSVSVVGVCAGVVGRAGEYASAGTSEVRVAPTCCTPVTPRIAVAKVLDEEWATTTPIAS
ncbi:hypothetical protein LUX01_01325 [Streptomyces sudanensis]|nr:hypothetical protein [Streptomyces sudanensis]